MSAHSLLGASGSHRWLRCPGSFALSQRLPHSAPSIYAATGSLAHEVIEKAWSRNVTRVGKVSPQAVQDGHVIDITDDFIDGINLMLDYIHKIDRGPTEVETMVWLDHLFTKSPPPVSMFGTLDVRAFDPDEDILEIVDYKNGAGVAVTPVENPQLLYYAAGAMTPVLWDKLRYIKLTIVQPHALGEKIKTWVIAPIDLAMWIDEVLIPGVEACAQPDAPLVPGSWCRFCPVAHGCPELHKKAVEAAKDEFADFTYIHADDLAAKLDTAAQAEIWIERVREFALNALQHQATIPGWGVVPTRPTRQWTQDEDATEDALAKLGVSRASVFENKLRSPAQLEKQLSRNAEGRRQWTAITTQGLVAARSSGVKLSRVTTAAEEFFDDL